MKTHTKIFVGYAVVVVAITIVMLVRSLGELREMRAAAEKLATQLNETPVKVVDITIDESSVTDEHWDSGIYWQSSNQILIGEFLKNTRISGDTLYVDGYKLKSNTYGSMIAVPGVNHAVIHKGDETRHVHLDEEVQADTVQPQDPGPFE